MSAHLSQLLTGSVWTAVSMTSPVDLFVTTFNPTWSWCWSQFRPGSGPVITSHPNVEPPFTEFQQDTDNSVLQYDLFMFLIDLPGPGPDLCRSLHTCSAAECKSHLFRGNTEFIQFHQLATPRDGPSGRLTI